MSGAARRRLDRRLFVAGCLAGCLLLVTATGQAQLPSLEGHRGETLADGWQLVDVESHREFVRLHFARGGESAHLEINARTQRDGQAHTERYAIQPAPEGFAPPALQDAVLLLLRDIERTEPAPSPAVGVKVARVVLLLQLLLALATAFLLVGLGVTLHQRRRAHVERPPSRGLRAHALPLVVFTTSGALLRVAGGNRVPGFEGGYGQAHGFGDMAVLLGERLPRLDPHGSGPAALAQLLFAVAPQQEATWIALQATLAVLTIPLVYLAALGWLRSTREATWATAVYALLPCAAYFAMTEVRTVPGAFFMMLSVALTGAAVSTERASWLASAGLFAVLATTFHPVLAAAPLVMALALIARDDAAAFVSTPRALLALAGAGAAWAIMLRLLALQLESGGDDQLIGGSVLGPLVDAPRLLLPTLSSAPARPFNAILNISWTPPLIALAWVAGLAALRFPARRRVLVTLLLAALGMTLPGMSGGRLNLARLQYAATPLHAMLAGVGIVNLLEFLASKLTATHVQRGIPAAVAIAMGLSVAVSPGPLSESFVYENERSMVLGALPALTAVCDVWVAPTLDAAYTGVPSYLTRERLEPTRWKALRPTDDATAHVAASLARDGCAYYYRPSVCWSQREDEPPATPDPTALRSECAATEAQLVLEPLHVETIAAVPAAAASYRRPQIEVGFFRIRALAL